MSKSIAISLVQLARDESIPTTMDRIEELNSALETIAECGSAQERQAASFLLTNIATAFNFLATHPNESSMDKWLQRHQQTAEIVAAGNNPTIGPAPPSSADGFQ